MKFRIPLVSLSAIIILLSTAVSDLFAKCGLVPYIISGRVIELELDSRTCERTMRKAIGDAQVFLFFDDYESTSSAGYYTKYPDYFKTNASGEFEATMYFDSFSGWSIFTGDRCNARPKTVTVVITAEGYLTKRRVFKTKDLEIKSLKILLPDVDLRLPLTP